MDIHFRAQPKMGALGELQGQRWRGTVRDKRVWSQMGWY